MIAVRTKTGTLLDREALAVLLDRPRRTIRAHCEIVGYRNGRAVYDAEACTTTLSTVEARKYRRVA